MLTPAMIAQLLALLFNAVLFSVGIYALARGGRPEQIGALVAVTASLGSAALRLAGLASWQAGGPTLLIDLAMTFVFFWMAYRTTRFWPIWSFGLGLAIVSVDIVKLALPAVTLTVFASGQIIYAYIVLLTIALGTYRAARQPRDPNNGFRQHADEQPH